MTIGRDRSNHERVPVYCTRRSSFTEKSKRRLELYRRRSLQQFDDDDNDQGTLSYLKN